MTQSSLNLEFSLEGLIIKSSQLEESSDSGLNI